MSLRSKKIVRGLMDVLLHGLPRPQQCEESSHRLKPNQVSVFEGGGRREVRLWT